MIANAIIDYAPPKEAAALIHFQVARNNDRLPAAVSKNPAFATIAIRGARRVRRAISPRWWAPWFHPQKDWREIAAELDGLSQAIRRAVENG
jgi:hypothetical protein